MLEITSNLDILTDGKIILPGKGAPMTLEIIEGLILEVLKEVQELSGREWTGLGTGDKPIGGLNGFDSICSMEATVMVEQKLGGDSLGAGSLFISDDGIRACTIREIAERIQKITTTHQGK